MKIFISSLITGMEPFRAAARDAVMQLGHEPVMAEDFGARPTSPQIACLQGLRTCGALVLILGADYGAKQNSGRSATHEEYLEAKDRLPVFAFVQDGVTRDVDETAFLREVQDWDTGLFRDSFATPDQLRTQITKKLHQWELSTLAGPVDEQEILQRVLALTGEDRERSRRSDTSLLLAIASAPRQPVLRPAELERTSFHDALLQAALFGDQHIFTPAKSTTVHIENHSLVLSHDGGAGAVSLDGEGNLKIFLPLSSALHGMVVIEEDLTSLLSAGLRYAGWLLDHIDPTQRLTHFALASKLVVGHMAVWRTQQEQSASPNSYSMSIGNREIQSVHLMPAHRPRPALRHAADQIVEDLITLLRREAKQQ